MNQRSQSVLLALLPLLLLTPALALAQAGGPYDLSWSTVNGGGHTFSTGGAFDLGGTVGQTDAGLMNGGGYTLAGGFWPGAPGEYRLYLPVILVK